MAPKALRKWSWTHKWSSIICTLFMLMLCAAFALDTLQVRSFVRAEAKHGFELAAAKAMILALVVIVAFVMLAVAGFKAASSGARERHRKHRGEGLIVGADGPMEQDLPKNQAGKR